MRSPVPVDPRRGQLIPMMGVVLVVFGFMAVSYMFHSKTVTSVTGIAVYGQKAHQLALAVAEEAGLVLQVKTDDVRYGGEWKQELLSLLDGQEDGTTVELDKDLTGECVEAAVLVSGTANAELMEARVKFHGFHQLNYASTDAYDAVESYYRNHLYNDEDDPEDENKVVPARDWIGFATVQTRVSVRGIERQVQITHDVKLVDTSPWAREFAFFNWLPLTQEQESAGLGFTSFNEGGNFTLWPNKAGRVLVRGPYRIITEGDSDGDGGKDRGGDDRQNLSYPRSSDKWSGWAAIPRLRALLYNPIAWPWGRNVRPEKDGVIPAIGLRIPTVSGVTLYMSDRSIDCSSQQYFVASAKAGSGAQKFSIWGRPGDNSVTMPPDADGNPPDNGWSMFRGLKVKFEDEGATVLGVHDGTTGLGSGSNGECIVPEGIGLWGLYKLADFKKLLSPGLCAYYVPPVEWLVDAFMIRCIPAPGCIIGGLATLDTPDDLDSSNVQSAGSGGDYQIAPYGLYYMEKESSNIWVAVIGVVIQYVAAAASGSTFTGGEFIGGQSFGVWGEFTWAGLGNFMSFVGTSLQDNLWLGGGMSVMSAFSGGGSMPTASDIASNVPEGLYPPKFHPPLRGATRIHPTLEDALNADGDRLTLDGVVVTESFPNDQEQSFQYQGRGLLFTATTGDDANKNPFLGDIGPADPGSDWLTFAHFVQRLPPADGGDCQVQINSNDLRMTLYSQEGVMVDGTSSSIVGNLVVGTPNKHKVAEGSEFHVFYDYKRLANPTQGGESAPDSWIDGTWKHVSVSPKVSGYYDRFH